MNNRDILDMYGRGDPRAAEEAKKSELVTPTMTDTAIGKPIILTLPPASERQIHLLARLCEMTVNHFRSAIVASFLIEQGLLGEI